MNKGSVPLWRCPHCNHVVGPEDLARDLAMETRLKELRKNVVEIEYTKDHTSYQIIKLDDPDSDESDEELEEDNGDQNDSKNNKKKLDDAEDHSSVTAKRAKIDVNTSVKQIVEPAVEVIDLLSDDE